MSGANESFFIRSEFVVSPFTANPSTLGEGVIMTD